MPLIICGSILLMTACKSNEIGNSKDVNPDAIYQDYSIEAEEGKADADCMAQFRFGGSNGTTLVLNDKSHVSLDEQQIAVDSSSAMGAFYRTSLPMPGGAGKHQWTFVDNNGKAYVNPFELQPFTLGTDLSKPVTANDLTLHFVGTLQNDVLRVEIRDTSSMSRFEDVDSSFTINDGSITIPGRMMKRLAPGPITVDISKFKEVKLERPTAEGGAIHVTYQLKQRETRLKK